MPRSVAIIGSFRQHYGVVLSAWRTFKDAGWLITSPLGDPIVEEGIPFVRFTSDEASWGDPEVQTVALHRILRADLVYVAAPKGYVGRTTCYEIGRVVQADRPIYFSEGPDDLPLLVPDDRIVAPAELVDLLTTQPPRPLYADVTSRAGERERALLRGEFLEL